MSLNQNNRSHLVPVNGQTATTRVEVKSLEMAKQGNRLLERLSASRQVELLADQAYLKVGEQRYKEAIELLTQAISMDARPSTHLSTTVMLLLQEKQEREALEMYNAVERDHPESLQHLYCKTTILLWQKKYDEALATQKKIMQQDTSCAAYCRLAKIYSDMKDEARALQCRMKTLELNPFCRCAGEKAVIEWLRLYNKTHDAAVLRSMLATLTITLRHFPMSSLRVSRGLEPYAPYFAHFRSKAGFEPELTGTEQEIALQRISEALTIAMDLGSGNYDVGRYDYYYKIHAAGHRPRKQAWAVEAFAEERKTPEAYLLAHVVLKENSRQKSVVPEERLSYAKRAIIYLATAEQMDHKNPLLKLYVREPYSCNISS